MEQGSFFEGLEQLYALGQHDQAEAYMRRGLQEAALAGDGRAVFAVMNELIGYYRVHSRYEECALCIEQAMELAGMLGLEGTIDYGTMLLNAATGYRAAGRYEEAKRYYKEAQKIYARELPEGDYRMASLHNNVSLLYIESGQPEAALKELEAALEILQGSEGVEGETAVTHTNLGTVLFQLGRNKEGVRQMEKAVGIFEGLPGGKDPHYPAALSGLGEAYYRTGDLERAADHYEKALEEIRRIYGEGTKDYQTVRKNLGVVRDLLERQKAVECTSGMELSRAYYGQFGVPMLRERYPGYVDRIAVGLVGEGSECMGYDDRYSTDHDLGPGFCMWLTKEDCQQIGDRLQKDYDRLPQTYRGLQAKHLLPQGKARVGVFCIDDFFRRYTGYSQAPEREEDWMRIPGEGLYVVTDGMIFRDDLGLFSKRRAAFSHYPPRVRMKKLAAALGQMAQCGQYNLGRARKRSDVGAMYFSLSGFIQAAVETIYLLNDRYQPFYKWRMRGMAELEHLGSVKGMLEDLMRMPLEDERIDMEVEKICQRVVKELVEQGLSDRTDAFLEEQKRQVLKKIEVDVGYGKEGCADR